VSVRQWPILSIAAAACGGFAAGNIDRQRRAPSSNGAAAAQQHGAQQQIRYDTRCYFNVRSKADMSQLNLPHGTDNQKSVKQKN